VKLGVGQFLRDLHGRRYRFRQAIGGAFGVCLVVLARPSEWGTPIGLALIIVGVLVRLWAAGLVLKSRRLATHGPYAFVRHPQYLGNTLVAIGLCLATGYVAAIAIWAAIFYLFYLPAIRREDAKLARRFGAEWLDWRRRTPAVVPSRWPSLNPGLDLREWSPGRALRNGEFIWVFFLASGVSYLCWLRLVSS